MHVVEKQPRPATVVGGGGQAESGRISRWGPLTRRDRIVAPTSLAEIVATRVGSAE
jgi:hypothetical protein